MDKYNALYNTVAEVADDFREFYQQGNHAAGVRVRRKMQCLKVIAQEVRTDVQRVKGRGAGTASAETAATAGGE